MLKKKVIILKLELYLCQTAVVLSKLNIYLMLFLIPLKCKNFFILLSKKSKITLIRSPHVDKKSQEKFIQKWVKISYFFNFFEIKNFFISLFLYKNILNFFFSQRLKKKYLILFNKYSYLKY